MNRDMIRLKLSLELDYEVSHPGCDFIFNIHAAHTVRQQVLDERLTLSQNIPSRVETDPVTLNRYMRVSARPGPLTVPYSATVELSVLIFCLVLLPFIIPFPNVMNEPVWLRMSS